MSPFFIALTLVDVLLLFMLVRLPVRAHWAWKAIAIVVVLTFNFLAWSAADSGKGWPKRSPFPASSQFVACSIVEPDIATHETGAIYVWVIPLNFRHGVLSYRPNHMEPRAYIEPYDRSLHVACLTAAKASGSGTPVTIRRSAGHSSGGGQMIRGPYHAYVLPTPREPSKSAEN